MLVVLWGLFFIGIGVGFFLYANLGADTASVFAQGVDSAFGIGFGHAVAAINLCILAVVFFIDRSYINITSILSMLTVGYIGQIVYELLTAFISPNPIMPTRVISLLTGILIIGINVPIYVRANLGVGAFDLLPELISDKFNLNYRWVRIACDFSYVLIGVILGANFGFGTVVTVLALGPVIAFFRPKVEKVVDAFVIV
ncbi:MAG: membrane protein [Eubacteriales bacterium]|nr:membrane protein [Eubacteriales bacterium]